MRQIIITLLLIFSISNIYSQNKTSTNAQAKLAEPATNITDPNGDPNGDPIEDPIEDPGAGDSGLTTEVGNIKGELSVSLTGAATYNIAISVPVGINNVVPKISLTYNSQTGYGTAGYGWNIGGVSMITRIPATKFHDDFIDPVDFDTNDRFALDGQRLILTGGIYGAVGSTYTTENFSNVKVSLTSAITTSSHTENGVTSTIVRRAVFKVEYPDGSVAFYGNTEDSSTDITAALSQWENPQGIKINYFYDKSENYLYISTIKYGSTNSNSHMNKIQFNYIDKAIREQFFVGNIEIINSKKLSEINVSSNAIGYRNYKITYNTLAKYERLVTFSEYSGDNSKNYYPLYFDYGISQESKEIVGISTQEITSPNGGRIYPTQGFNNIQGDFNGDGDLDLNSNYGGEHSSLFTDVESSNVNLTATASFSTNINRDNYKGQFTYEGLELNPTTSGYKKMDKQGWCIISSGDVINNYLFKMYSLASDNSLTLNQTKEAYAVSSEDKRNFLNGDFNGDGISDVIIINDNPNLVANLDRRGKLTYVNLDPRVTSNYVSDAGKIDLPTGIPGYESGYWLYLKTADVNGDGKTDLIVFNPTNISVYSLDATNTVVKQFEFNININLSVFKEKSVSLGDFNGDGKTDIVLGYSPRVILYSTGTSFKSESLPSTIPVIDKNNFFMSYDINNDKKSDLVCIKKEITYLYAQQGHLGGGYYDIDVLQDGTVTYTEQYTTTHDHTVSAVMFSIMTFINNGVNSSSNTTQWSGTMKQFIYDEPEINCNPDIFLFPVFIKPSKDLKKTTLGIYDHRKAKILNYDIYSLGEETLLKSISSGNLPTQKIAYSSLLDDGITYTKANQIENYPNYDIKFSKTYKVVNRIEQSGGGVYKKQDFKYHGATFNFDALGFLGFRSVLKTNWYVNPSTIISNITKFDIGKRGAPIDNFSVLGLVSPTMSLSAGTPFISRTETIYNNENTSYENPLLPNKVFNLKSTFVKQTNGLEGTSKEIATVYNTNNSPTQITVTSKKGATTEKVATQILSYDSITTPYMVDRLTQKNSSAIIYPSGNTTSSEEVYTYANNLVTQIKKKGDGTDYIIEGNQYDSFGNIIKKTLSTTGLTPRVSDYEYDTSGRFLTKKTDIERLVTNYTYDMDKGLLLTESFPSISATNLKNTYTYDIWGKLVTSKNIYDKIEVYNYFNTYEGGFSKRTTGVDGSSSKVTYDQLGRKIRTEVIDINSNPSYVDIVYDIYDRVISESKPYSTTPTVWNEAQYDVYGRVSQATSLKSGSSPGKVVTYSYSGTSTTENDGIKSKTTTKNSLDQPVTIVETPGGTINYVYYANGNLKSTVCNGATISIVQDGWGHKKELNDPSAGNRKYDYNNFGELIREEVVGKGETIYDLNTVGKISVKTIKDSGGTVLSKNTYIYKTTNKLVESIRLDDYANSSFTTNDFTYDSYNNVLTTSEILDSKAKFLTTITYDGYGRPLTETYYAQNLSDFKSSSKTITNEYKNGYKLKIIDNDTGLPIWETKTVNAQGQLLTGTLGNGIISITNTYDEFGFPTQNKHDKASTNIMTLTNTFDPVRGNLLTRTNNMFGAWNEALSYDTADRLTVYKDIIGTQTQSYNDNGTIASNNLGDHAYKFPGKPYQVSSVTPIDQTATSPVLNYYTSRTQNIEYNTFKSPISIKEATKENIDFEYNAYNGRSVMYYGSLDAVKTSRPYRKYYSANGVMEIKIKTTTPTSVEFTTYIGGDAYSAPALLRSDGTTKNMHYLHRDYQGTIVAITNNLGVVVEKRLFDVWGELIKYQKGVVTVIPTTTGTMFIDRGYTGHEHLLGVNIINMNGRIYDHKFHRFLQPDNNIQEPTNTQNYNRYGYVMNNPTKYTDPSGEFWATLLGWLAGAAVSTYVHGAQATGNANPLQWNAGQWLNASLSATSSAVSYIATNSANSYILNYGNPSEAQLNYMANNPVNSVENHGHVDTSVNWANESGFDMASSGENDPFSFKGEYQVKQKDLLDFNFKLTDRFKGSGLNPNISPLHGSVEEGVASAMKVIHGVAGLNDFYESVGSPQIRFMGRSSEGLRGLTPGISEIYLYNGAYKSNYWLASTLFHELTHVYQDKYIGLSTFEAERMAYSVEWRLGNRDGGPGTSNYNQPGTIWSQIQFFQPNKK